MSDIVDAILHHIWTFSISEKWLCGSYVGRTAASTGCEVKKQWTKGNVLQKKRDLTLIKTQNARGFFDFRGLFCWFICRCVGWCSSGNSPWSSYVLMHRWVQGCFLKSIIAFTWFIWKQILCFIDRETREVFFVFTRCFFSLDELTRLPDEKVHLSVWIWCNTFDKMCRFCNSAL